MRCFAKQTKYFRNSEMYQTQTIELKICSNGIKQLRNNMKKYYVLISRVYERNISQNTRQGMKFPFTFQTWRYLYVTITCLHFYFELIGSAMLSRVIIYISENFKLPKSDSEMRWISIKIALH
jgi:hypothetical protein